CRVCGVFFCEMGSKNETSSATNGATPESIAFPASLISHPRLTPIIQTDISNSRLQIGDQLRERWVIKGLIGNGGYGEIYYAIDMTNGEPVAAKVEPVKRRGKVVRRMILEQKQRSKANIYKLLRKWLFRVLLRLQGQAHVPLMWGSGVERTINYIVMQVLSTNLNELRKQCPLKRLSRSTSGRVMQQAIAGLRDLHNFGYLHRDIKPANMCFGLTKKSMRRLFIVDYGLVRRFRRDDGQRVPQRAHVGFRGTMRYVSMRVHDRKEQGPSDDMIALFFCLLEALKGELPWKYINSDTKMKAMKMEMVTDDFAKLSQNFGKELGDFGRSVMNMSAEDEPNYGDLQLIMKRMCGGRHLSEPYDWENDYVEVFTDILSYTDS
uniref:non-specific serine/threonine protein kinase n=4 Tax=Parascaris univalens TaxID=6257 RepID=A0A915BK73_PARUN